MGAGQPRADGPAPGARAAGRGGPGRAGSRFRRTAALGYSAESGIPFNFGLIRNHYVGRTFIEPEQRFRDFGVKLKLNPVRNLLEGKRIILIDDSIIRGTTSRKSCAWSARPCQGSASAHQGPPTISPATTAWTPRTRTI